MHRCRLSVALLLSLVAALASGCASGQAEHSQGNPGISATATARTQLSTAGQQGAKPKQKKKSKRQKKATDHHKKATHHRSTSSMRVPAVDVPNHRLTPGVALPASVAQICTSGYASRTRDVSEAEKDAVYARYGTSYVPHKHQVDHLVSLEIGGSNSIRNLWPEPYAGRWGARTKDVLEDRLHDLVCSGRLGLKAAQHQEASNWVAAYRRYLSRKLPPRPASESGSSSGSGKGSAGGGSSGGYYASSYPSARTIYCADDSEWRSLSKTYLVHFKTWAAAHRRFPGDYLPQAC